MVIITNILAALTIAAFVGLFFKRIRKRAALVLAVSFVAGAVAQGIETARLDKEAQAAGFMDHKDFLAAEDADVESPEEWQTVRSERDAEEHSRAEQARLAEECSDRHSAEAFVMSQRPVKAALRAPATADFPSINTVTVTRAEGCRYVVNGYVDAQNGFGAQIRTSYRAVMQRDPDNGSWSVVELDM
ncbi:hypothetical protein [Celeribacter indicus]|uniref:Uncharacterized protein n=1 Tax=Celeribacter indicus TaxID=1208324 RepID=A0A0B5DSW1_9RHOB|nr:hypothetical protein [Celeribacter indicus]AJE46139.1 hypothetical protein P73_1424 [Celeribacter indicus]SDX37027.1 hypothetical protein SAMN05443573_12430 [Celeribacter indicus]